MDDEEFQEYAEAKIEVFNQLVPVATGKPVKLSLDYGLVWSFDYSREIDEFVDRDETLKQSLYQVGVPYKTLTALGLPVAPRNGWREAAELIEEKLIDYLTSILEKE